MKRIKKEYLMESAKVLTKLKRLNQLTETGEEAEGELNVNRALDTAIAALMDYVERWKRDEKKKKVCAQAGKIMQT